MMLNQHNLALAIKQQMPLINFKSGVCLTGEAVDAVAAGVVDIVTTTAIVTVPTRAGGEYAITGVNAAQLESAIRSRMPRFNFDCTDSEGYLVPMAISRAVSHVMAVDARVAVPLDGIDDYPLLYIQASALLAQIRQHLSSISPNAKYGRSLELFEACANAIAHALSVDAFSPINGLTGGNYPVQ